MAALQRNAEAKHTDLVVFSDGPKTDEDKSQVDAVRELIRSVTGFRSVELHAREKNVGLAESIIQGVTRVLESSETVIVMEDDLVSSPFFLQFMNAALKKYEPFSNVASVLGYSFPTRNKLPEIYFLRGADCWGWATWRRAWALFERDGTKLLNEIKKRKLEHEFDLQGSVPYLQMLEDQIAKKNNSWAIRWRASVFLKDAMAVYPGRSLIQNIGLDGTGTHCSDTDMFSIHLASSPIVLNDAEITESGFALNEIIRFYRSQKKFTKRAISYFTRRLRRIF